MMTVNIRVELSGLDKAMAEVKALETMILELAKTYPTTFATEVEETPVKKTVKAPAKPKATKEVPEPAQEVKEAKTAPKEKPAEEKTTITLSELTALAKSAVAKGGRDAVKELVVSFSTTSKLSDVPTDKYEELATALKGL